MSLTQRGAETLRYLLHSYFQCHTFGIEIQNPIPSQLCVGRDILLIEPGEYSVNMNFILQTAYKQKAEEEKHYFTVFPDRPDIVHAKEVDKNISDVS